MSEASLVPCSYRDCAVTLVSLAVLTSRPSPDASHLALLLRLADSLGGRLLHVRGGLVDLLLGVLAGHDDGWRKGKREMRVKCKGERGEGGSKVSHSGTALWLGGAKRAPSMRAMNDAMVRETAARAMGDLVQPGWLALPPSVQRVSLASTIYWGNQGSTKRRLSFAT